MIRLVPPMADTAYPPTPIKPAFGARPETHGDRIVRYVYRRGHASIGDIIAHFPSMSVGHVHVEMTALVRKGRLTRAARGIYTRPATGTVSETNAPWRWNKRTQQRDVTQHVIEHGPVSVTELRAAFPDMTDAYLSITLRRAAGRGDIARIWPGIYDRP